MGVFHPLLLTLAFGQTAKPVAVPRLPFAPRHYICQRATTPPTIDGRLDDEVWRKAAWTDDFVDIEGPLKPAPRFRTRVKMAWDDTYFYVAAQLEEPDLWAYQTARDSVIFQDNDFEVFIDPDGSTSPYLEFEMNALNTVWDLMLLRPYREQGRVAVNAWDYHGLKSAVALQGTLNRAGDKDQGWTLELAFPWESFAEFARRGTAPLPGDRWRVNFSRVEWRTEVQDGRYVKLKGPEGKPLPEDNWVWSPQGLVDMHCPEMWGFVHFSAKPAGETEAPVGLTPEDHAAWALRRIYYAQRNLQASKGRYAATLKELAAFDPSLEPLRLPEGWTLKLEAGSLWWCAEAARPGLRLRIDPQGALREAP